MMYRKGTIWWKRILCTFLDFLIPNWFLCIGNFQPICYLLFELFSRYCMSANGWCSLNCMCVMCSWCNSGNKILLKFLWIREDSNYGEYFVILFKLRGLSVRRFELKRDLNNGDSNLNEFLMRIVISAEISEISVNFSFNLEGSQILELQV